MNNIPKFSPHSDDEEDLEVLRLAALQSLKKPQTTEDPPYQFMHHTPGPDQVWPMKGFRNKRGKFYGQHQGWGRKDFQNYGHFTNRIRNSNLTNLIPITTIPDETEVSGNVPTNKEAVVDSTSSKFNRYDKSDKSESDSEDDLLSDEDGSQKLKRSNSLEALMEELDAEIQGKAQSKETKDDKPKIKKGKKKKKLSESENKVDSKTNIAEENNKDPDTASEILSNPALQLTDDKTSNCVKDSSLIKDQPNISSQGNFYGRKRHRSRSPHNRRGFPNRRRPRNFPGAPMHQPIHIPFGHPSPAQFPPQMMPFPEQQFNPLFMPQVPNPVAPPFFERPLSPLLINTDSLTTATMAPLSPRSAAFVLQNKAIVERRKRSPRRSYSRSLSRSPRRSLTPRRSPRRSVSPRRSRSPRRLPLRKRSMSPRKHSLSPRKRSLSPKLRRSLSPRRKSLSPKRKNVDKALDNRAPVRDRLGVKSKSEETKENPKKEEEEEEEEDIKKEEKHLDPILEARRKKFETNEIKKREGIIRLKPKDEKFKEDKFEVHLENPKEESKVEEKHTVEEKQKIEEKPKPRVEKPKENIVEVAPATTTVEEKPSQSEKDLSVPDEFRELEKLLNEDALLEGDDNIADPKVDDIFSDEDSTSDNEGRFKIKEQNTAKPPIISFSKLVNGTKTEIKSEPLPSSTVRSRGGKSQKDKGMRERDKRKFDRSHTPPPLDKKYNSKLEIVQDDKKSSNIEKYLPKQKISLKSERQPPLMDKRFERKIEIKIKNPSKYERSGKSKVTKIDETVPSKIERKVNLEDKDDDDDDFEPEIIVENESSSDEYSNITEGDLRAQLSKKRAKKLHKIPVDEVSSRLLQYALQGAVFKKKKKSKSKDLASSDGKLPIHLRLGLANLDRPKRKSRKRKNREVLEQV